MFYKKFFIWVPFTEYSFFFVFRDSVDFYSLYIAEDDGEVDSAFPCLDARETVAKFKFEFLALVERDPQQVSNDTFSSRYLIFIFFNQ